MLQSLPLIVATALTAGAAPAASPERIPAYLEDPADLNFDLSPYMGLGTLFDRGTSTSFAVAGALLRFRVYNIQFGAYASIADLPGEYLESYGGLIGANLPFFNWVDIDTALGLGVRSYRNSDRESYLGEYRIWTDAATARLGVSDRAGGLFGARVGAQLVAGLDLSREDKSWFIPPSEENRLGSSGTRRFGGLTTALVITFGLDVLPSYEPPAEPSPAPAAPAPETVVW